MLVPDAELDAGRLLTELAVLHDDGVRSAVAVAAHALGRPNAAAAIAADLLALADGRALPSEAAAS